jgi:hypothetical protein
MKNIPILLVFLYSGFLFGQPISTEICPTDDPRIIVTDPVTVYIEEILTNKPESLPPPPPPGDRIIFWVHGLGGNEHSWAVAAQEVRRDWDVSSLETTYSEFSLAVAGGGLHDNQLIPLGVPAMITNQVDDPMENFLIAHSQGGLVSRATDAFYIDQNFNDEDRMFGGIVTFGSPHAGAKIINNIPDIQDFAAVSCDVLIDGPAEENFQGNWYIDLIIPDDTFEEALDQLCGFVGSQVLPSILSNFQAGITDDYAVGSPALSDLNNVSSTIPGVAFHGIEEDPIIWRTLFSLQNNPNDFPAFGADDEQEMIDWANENTLMYEMKYYEYSDQYDESPSGFLWNGILNFDDNFGFGDGDALNLMLKYYQGWQWWLRADVNYKTLIGAVEYEPNGIGFLCECETDDSYGNYTSYSYSFVESEIECYNMEDNYTFCEATEVELFTRVDYQSDGIVLASSAMAYPGADVGPDNAMHGSNHQQMRNDSNLEVKLRDIS